MTFPEFKDFLEAFSYAATIVGIPAAIFVFFYEKRKDRVAQEMETTSQRLAAHREIGERYGKLMDFRTSHPEVLALSRKWEASKMKCAYEQVTPEDRQWAIYYCYVELCIAYCNAVLYAWNQKLLDKNAYDNEYKLLVKLLLTEHNPIIEAFTTEGKYISTLVQEFRRELQAQGWNWEQEHQAVTTLLDPPNFQIKPPPGIVGRLVKCLSRARLTLIRWVANHEHPL